MTKSSEGYTNPLDYMAAMFYKNKDVVNAIQNKMKES